MYVDDGCHYYSTWHIQATVNVEDGRAIFKMDILWSLLKLPKGSMSGGLTRNVDRSSCAMHVPSKPVTENRSQRGDSLSNWAPLTYTPTSRYTPSEGPSSPISLRQNSAPVGAVICLQVRTGSPIYGCTRSRHQRASFVWFGGNQWEQTDRVCRMFYGLCSGGQYVRGIEKDAGVRVGSHLSISLPRRQVWV